MSVRRVVRCEGRTKTGQRCSRKTAKTELCYQHLEAKYHVKIKKSHIAGAGMGLYSTVSRKTGDNFAPYSGNVVRSDDPKFGGDYVLQIKKHPPTFIDARASTSGAGRYSNNGRRGGPGEPYRNNAKFSYNNNSGNASIKATRNVPANGEVYTAYGNSYWDRKPE